MFLVGIPFNRLNTADYWIVLMTFEYEKLKNWKFEEVTQNYTSRDTILYALGAVSYTHLTLPTKRIV